jgi:hypothetical protein
VIDPAVGNYYTRIFDRRRTSRSLHAVPVPRLIFPQPLIFQPLFITLQVCLRACRSSGTSHLVNRRRCASLLEVRPPRKRRIRAIVRSRKGAGTGWRTSRAARPSNHVSIYNCRPGIVEETNEAPIPPAIETSYLSSWRAPRHSA